MFGFLRRKKKTVEPVTDSEPEQQAEQQAEHSPLQPTEADPAQASEPVSEASPPETSVPQAPTAETPLQETPVPDSPPEAAPKPATNPAINTKQATAATHLADNITATAQQADNTAENSTAHSPPARKSLFGKLRDRLSKTRAGLTDGMADLLLGKKNIDDDLLEELETRLLTADVGVEATTKIITDLTRRVSRKELNNPEALFQALCDDMQAILKPVDKPLIIPTQDSPFVILVIGINGAGKTTTIGKLAKRFQSQGKSVMLAAGDTFRAAAVEQLQTWGERNNISVVSQGTGADSASVIFDAIASAKAKDIDIVIADTAGRLHTQSNLMDELIKIKRVMSKLDESAPHETLLVMDAGFGQNGLIQAQQFNEAMGLSGLVLTKLDGTAKGGILFAIAEKLSIPIRFIGVGESIDDLREFHAPEFVDALLDKEPS
ncbi:Signal recognition particle receptor FtsY [hydrothermal vent metagenome]|uniref:Signal recognition particle receptor FtsY n=1 Tax=hydrothermal vent metagenome TaxID=652676 RepID=A0A3B0XPH9_9ZZZZ